MTSNGRLSKDKKLIKPVAIALVCVVICFAVGAATILYLQQHAPRLNTSSDVDGTKDEFYHETHSKINNRPWSTKDEFYQNMKDVKIGTARDIVERSIGKPDLCSRKIYRGEYELQRCGYNLGDPETYQEIVYMNGAVWGISSVVGSINQLNSF